MRLLALMLVALIAFPAPADIVKLKGGGTLEGEVLEKSDTTLTLKIPYGVVKLARHDIESIEEKPFKAPPPRKPAGTSAPLPSWDTAVKYLADQPWAKGLEQIPATVIDQGVLRNVPYMSYQAGDYEVNIYGDPDEPACIEVGVYHGLVNDSTAQENCVDFACKVLGDTAGAKEVRALKRGGESTEYRGLTLEVTPPSAPDAYGGWWVSIYDTKKLDTMRASDKELAEIAVPRDVVPPQPAPPAAKPKQEPKPERIAAPAPEPTDWTPSQVRKSRPPSTASSSGSSGRVYVRGYYRKDGTYVRPHTRSAPRRGNYRRPVGCTVSTRGPGASTFAHAVQVSFIEASSESRTCWWNSWSCSMKPSSQSRRAIASTHVSRSSSRLQHSPQQTIGTSSYRPDSRSISAAQSPSAGRICLMTSFRLTLSLTCMG